MFLALKPRLFLAKSDIFIPKCTEGGSTGLKIFPLCELSVPKKGVATFSANMFAFVGTPLFGCTVQGGPFSRDKSAVNYGSGRMTPNIFTLKHNKQINTKNTINIKNYTSSPSASTLWLASAWTSTQLAVIFLNFRQHQTLNLVAMQNNDLTRVFCCQCCSLSVS